MGLIPGSGRSAAVGNGNPLQYSFPEHPVDRGAWGHKEPDVTECTYTHTTLFICSETTVLVACKFGAVTHSY